MLSLNDDSPLVSMVLLLVPTLHWFYVPSFKEMEIAGGEDSDTLSPLWCKGLFTMNHSGRNCLPGQEVQCLMQR